MALQFERRKKIDEDLMRALRGAKGPTVSYGGQTFERVKGPLKPGNYSRIVQVGGQAQGPARQKPQQSPFSFAKPVSQGGWNIFADAGNFVKDNIVKPTVEGVQNVGEGLGYAFEDIAGITKQREDAFNREQDDTQRRMMEQIKRSQDTSLPQETRNAARRSSQSFSNIQDQAYKNYQGGLKKKIEVTDPIRQAGSIVSTASIVPFGAGVSGAARAGSSLIKSAASNAGKEATLGGVFGAGSVAQEKGGNATAEDYLAGIGAGAVFGGVLGGAGGAFTNRAIAGDTSNALQRAGNDPFQETLDEAAETLLTKKQPQLTPIAEQNNTPLAPFRSPTAQPTRPTVDARPIVRPISDNPYLRELDRRENNNSIIDRDTSLEAAYRPTVENDPIQRARVELLSNPVVQQRMNQSVQEAQQLLQRPRVEGLKEAPIAREQGDELPVPEAYRERQDQRQAQYKQKPVVRALNAVQRELFDPRNIEQRLDARQFRFQKEQGNVRPGQKELLPDEALADIRRRIQNPYQAAGVRDKTKYRVDDSEFSLDDIIRIYGKDDSPKAREFENYRIFRDELERIEKSGQNTLGIDPETLLEEVIRYERANPDAIRHNAALRQHQLDILTAKRDARIDDPTLYDNSVIYDYFNPRAALDPEDLIRPKMEGGVRSGAKQTQTRSETAGGVVRSPLSLFKDRSVEAGRSLAEQRYGTELRQRVSEGTIPGAREVIDADVAVQNKKALREMRSLIKDRQSLVTLKKGTKAELNKAKTVAKAEKEAVAFVRKYLSKANQNDIFADLKGIKLTDKEAADLFKVMAGSKVKNTRNLVSRIAKGTGSSPEQINEYLAGIRNAIRDTQSDILDARNTASLTSQNLERGTQTYTYKVDGEVGKIELPADLAESLAKQNEAQNLSMLEKGLKPVAGVQKLTWTGILQPAFKIWNVLVKNPLLMYRNADGLSGIRPEAGLAILRQVVNTPKMQQFKQEMKVRGAAYENILQTKNIQSTTADDIARRAGIIEWSKGLATNPVQSFQDVWKGINQVAAFPDNAQRTAVAYGAYKRARGLGFNEKEALDIASKAPAKVFGDFDRISRLAQNMEVLIPYTGAIQAGTRALYQATKQKPIATTFKDAALLTTMAAATSYSLQNSQEGNDYYQDMIDSGKEYELDNNWTIVLPGASRDSGGNWSGVIKIPLLPDVRPMNRAAWKSTRELAQGEDLDPALVGGELFNQLTGDLSSNLYDQKKGEKNTINGILPSSPIVNVGKTLGGVNMYTGDPLADEFVASKPRVEQVGKNTTEGAKKASKLTQGVLTPQQFDQLFNMTGSTGDILQEKEGSGDIVSNILKPIQPGVGQKDSSKSGMDYYKDREQVASTLKNEDDFRAYQSITGKNSVKTVEDSAARAKELLARPSVLKALKELDSRKRGRGEAGDPFFDLSPQQQEKVLRYRGAKDLNSAKQAYDKNGNPLFMALGLDEKWYDTYKDKEDVYYDTITAKQKKEVKNIKEALKKNPNDKGLQEKLTEIESGINEGDTILTYSGAKKPKASPELQKKLDYYFTLPESTGQRSDFLDANPDVLDHWAKGDQFTSAERVAMGLEPVSDEDSYDSGSSGGGGYKKGYGSGGGGGSDDPRTLNARQYAISPTTGGEISSPKVSVKAGPATPKKYAARKRKSLPKATLKKSQV